MIAITSISPSHRHGDHQQNCIQTWINLGYEVHSLNHADEIKEISPKYPSVKFFATQRTHKVMLGRHYVLISAMLDHAKDQKGDHFLLINSDIEIYDVRDKTKEFVEKSNDGIIVIHREDYEEDVNESKRYVFGIDGFIINRKFLDVYPQSLLCMGQCFWDFWIPFAAIQKGVKVFIPNSEYLFHKAHNAQYSPELWDKFGKIMQHETGLTKFTRVHQFSAAVYDIIMKNRITI